MTPKAFISYSWSSPAHQSAVLEWAEQLIHDGVEVVLDLYDLKEGHDKYAFMERMVADPSVTHVLVISDSEYAKKPMPEKQGSERSLKLYPKKSTRKSINLNSFPLSVSFSRMGIRVCRRSSNLGSGLIFLRQKQSMKIGSALSEPYLGNPFMKNQNWGNHPHIFVKKPLHQLVLQSLSIMLCAKPSFRIRKVLQPIGRTSLMRVSSMQMHYGFENVPKSVLLVKEYWRTAVNLSMFETT